MIKELDRLRDPVTPSKSLRKGGMDYPTEDPVDRLSAFHKGQENSRYRPGVDSPGSSIFDLPVHSDESHKTDLYLQLPPEAAPGQRAPGHTITDSANTSSPVLPQLNQTFLVISGGTGCNSICSAFGDASYILPVSDDGGSSSEIIRVIGGPSIGMILELWGNYYINYKISRGCQVPLDPSYPELGTEFST